MWAVGWILGAIVLSVAVYWSTVMDLGALWTTTQDYGHGFLLVPIALYLLWQQRSHLAAIPHRPIWWVGLMALIPGTLWLASYLVSVQVGMQLAWFGMLLCTAWALAGTARFWAVLFPLTYIIFAIPVWGIFVPALQALTADVATWGVRSLGIPVFREGAFLTIPEGRFAEVCAGLRFLMAAMSISALYAYLNFESWPRRFGFFSVAVVWAIFFNWVRVVVVIALGHALGLDAPLVEDHNAVGWVLFAVSLVPLFVLGHFLQTGRIEDAARTKDPDLGPRRSVVLTLLCVVLGLGSGPAIAAILSQQAVTSGPVAPLSFPAVIGNWKRVGEGGSVGWHPVYVGAARVDRATYQAESDEVSVYVARYRQQGQGREIISDLNRPFDEEWWSVGSLRETHWTGKGGTYPARLLVLRGRGIRQVELSYVIGRRSVADNKLAKLVELTEKLRGHSQAALVAVAWDGDRAESRSGQIGGAIVEIVLAAHRGPKTER